MHEPDDAPAWTIQIDGVDPAAESARSAMLTLADGVIGTRADASGAEPGAGSLAAGVYRGEGPESELAPLPSWNQPPLAGTTRRRVLDLRDGTLQTVLASEAGDVSLLAFTSLARPGTAALVVEGAGIEPVGHPLRVPPGAEQGSAGGRSWARVQGSGGAAVAASERIVRQAASRARLERLVAYASDPGEAPSAEAALEALAAAEQVGIERLLAEQRSHWARRWAAADIRIQGAPELQRAVRFCLFHLMSAVSDRAEAALGAKGLSGPGYRGHVFWDTDIFVLPFLAATHPPAARALVGYRANRLAAARACAAAAGYEGARFPWESAASGEDVTPRQLRDKRGELVDVLTGPQEEHITADVAWSTSRYQAWSGDGLTAACDSVLSETAGYWASRVRLDEGGRAHIDTVMGPDEYHESIDDNAFTNAMARWNLMSAARLDGVAESERARWSALAEALADGYDAASGRHAQFAGYFELEPLTVADLPAGADPVDVLGWERLQGTQLLKQADVLMLHLLVPELAADGSLRADVEWYMPRTTHASSLSAPVHAAVLARAGLLDDALRFLETAATTDLEDRTGSTAQGLHMAAMGGVWHALVHGVAGLQLHGGRLSLHPHLPAGWDSLDFQVLIHGVAVEVSVQPDRVRLRAERGCGVRVGRSGDWVEVGPAGVELEHDALGWQAAG